MAEDWDGTRRIIWAKNLDDMELIGTNMFTVGVPVEADPEFKAYVFAAGVTHSMGNRSIDGQLRRHREKWIRRFLPHPFQPGSQELLMQQVRAQAMRRVHELSNIKLPQLSGLVAAANALIRLPSTFRGALQLIRLGFPFEAEAVIRLGYEQAAWAYAVAPFDDVDRIEQVLATRAITQLREILPAAGRIYGKLSNFAHVAPSTHHRVVSVDDDEKVWIQIEAHEATRESLWLLIMLLDALFAVSEARFHQYGIERVSLDASTGKVSPGRAAITLMKEFRNVLPPHVESTLQSWSDQEP